MSTHAPSILLAAFLLSYSHPSYASGPEEEHDVPVGQTFGLHGYGVLNYFGYKWDTDPARRNAIDVERLVLYPSARLSPSILVKAEVEFEHGGTGSTIEFDRFEEFGEYESEVEKGGEVELDQLHVQINLSPLANFRVGRVKLPVGLIASYHEPGEYFTTTRSEMETSLIPAPWYENGIEFYGSLFAENMLQFNLLVVNGLDATGFSSANWVAPGHQLRFETVNAENLAFVVGLTLEPADELLVGGSVYYGNSTDNRPKPDLTAPAHVAVYELHTAWEFNGLEARAMGLYGTLENADLVSQANRNVSNNLNVKRTPVASAASGFFVEAAYNVLHSTQQCESEILPFIRYESYDSMAKVKGEIFDNPRWKRTAVSFGVNYKPIHDLVFKAEYQHRKLGIPEANVERTFSLGVGFEFP